MNPTTFSHDALTQDTAGDLWPHDGEGGSCSCGLACGDFAGSWDIQATDASSPIAMAGDGAWGVSAWNHEVESPSSAFEQARAAAFLPTGVFSPAPSVLPTATDLPDPPCPDPAAPLSFEEVDLADSSNTDHLVFRPVDTRLPWFSTVVNRNLIVMLPGDQGQADNIDGVLVSFAAAGFRAIGLTWNEPDHLTARLTCQAEAAVEEAAGLDPWTESMFNLCLELERAGKMIAFQAKLISVLEDLATNDDPTWGDFLDSNGLPDWSRIVLAGYSEGANQTGYHLRRLHNWYGAILISGGGDLGMLDRLEPPQLNGLVPDIYVLPFEADVPAPPFVQLGGGGDGPALYADWFTQLPDNPRVVGLAAQQEPIYTIKRDGFARSGAPQVDITLDTSNPTYASMMDASRLTYDCHLCEPTDAHGKTNNNIELAYVYMYMACKAGRVE